MNNIVYNCRSEGTKWDRRNNNWCGQRIQNDETTW